MTVAELISLLQTCVQDRRVVIRGYESGVNDIRIVCTVNLQLNANTEWYYGKHEKVPQLSGTPYDEQAYEICS